AEAGDKADSMEGKSGEISFVVESKDGKDTVTAAADVYHITNDGDVEKVGTAEAANGKATAEFAVDEFSTFVVNPGGGSYSSLAAAVNAAPNGATITITQGGDLGVNEHIYVKGKSITIDLNGQTINSKTTDETSLINVVKDGNGNKSGLTLEDSKGGGTINGTDAYASLIYVGTGCEMTMDGGTLQNHNNQITDYGHKGGAGGAIFIQGSGGWSDTVKGFPATEKATFTMNGGTIQNCNAGSDTTNMTSGDKRIVNAGDDWDKYYHLAGHGGGIFAMYADVTINGGTIDNCEAQYKGGGMAISHDCNFKMTGGSVTNCVSGAEGGGIALKYWGAKGEIIADPGKTITISGNESRSYCKYYGTYNDYTN
ncbi:MAG: hypothetical protein HUJ79_07610, partial [Firmicutes bacterium]|nr:hypothetical protein [Bacillota bacterium]